MSSLLRGLNPAQHEAVKTTEGPLLVLAGAGTGKTRVITYRIGHLLEKGVPPENILAVTFTNKAAREMRERVGHLLGKRPKGLTLSTFHALGVRILRENTEALGLRPGFTIYDQSDQVSLVRSILRETGGVVSSGDAQSVLSKISLAKNKGKTPEDLVDESIDEFEYLVARVYYRYQDELRSLGTVDFDDLIRLPVELLETNTEIRDRYRRRFRYIMIDEYQDTNGSQYRFTLGLVGPERNVCVVGDDDQSIYGFRGAEMDKILRFEKDFLGANVVRLEENYRSTGSILNLANAVISPSPLRYPKELRANSGEGHPVEWIITPNADGEVDCIIRKILEFKNRDSHKLEDIAVLLRSSIQARPFEEKLRQKNIPYKLVGGKSWFDRKEIRDVLAYWKVLCNPRDDLSLLRIINVPKRGIGATSIGKLDEFAREQGVPILEALTRVAEGEGDFSARIRTAGGRLAATFQQVHEALSETGDYPKACNDILEQCNYTDALKELYSDPLVLLARRNSIDQLVESIERWRDRNLEADFAEYLSSLSLDRDDAKEEETVGLSLMTLHSAKGLEFPTVFLPGMEDDILPHRRSIDDGDHAIEEERRLLYVGVTRARTRLIMTAARQRKLYGQDRDRIGSRFLLEVSDQNVYRRSDQADSAPAAEEEVKDMIAEFLKQHEKDPD